MWGKNFEQYLGKVRGVVLKIFSPHFILLKAQIAPQACAFGLPMLQKPKIAVFRWPIASRLTLFIYVRFGSNWPPENSNFGLLKGR